MDQNKRKKTIAKMYIATCFLWFSIYFYVPILSPYCEGLGVNYTMIGTILSSYGLVQLILRLPIGVWSDRINKRKAFLILGMASALLSGVGFFFAKTPMFLLVCRSLAGLSASTWAIYMVSYNSYYSLEQQSKSMGIISTSMFVGQVIATFLGGIVATYFNEELTFLVSAVSAAIGIVLLSTVPEPPTEQKMPPKVADFVALFKNKDLIFFSLMAVLLQIGSFAGVFGFIPNVLRDMGANNFTLGLSSTFATLLAIATSYFSGSFFEDKLGVKVSVIVSFLLSGATLVAMAFAKQIWVILLLVLISGAPRGILQPLLNSLAIRGVNPDVRSSAAAMFQSIYGLGMTVGPIIAGALADAYGMAVAFVGIGLITASAIIFLIFKRKWPTWATE